MSFFARCLKLRAKLRASWHALAGLTLLALAVLTAPGVARASVPGATTAEFSEALALWLADEEESALTEMAELARAGNVAAQILLALIDKTPALQGPWLAHLQREDRIALMRAPGGISGRSWLFANDHALSLAWQRLLNVDAGADIIATFHALGEPRAAREALVMLAAREHPDLRGIALSSIDVELLYLLWRNADEPRRAALLALVPPGHPQRLMMGAIIGDGALQDWLLTAPVAEPLRAVCRQRCPDSLDACLSGAYGALGSHNALMALGSPVETLVGQDDFLNSPRGMTTILRRILQSTDARGRRSMIGQMQDHDQCLAEVLRHESDRYRYRRPGTTDEAVSGSDAEQTLTE